MKDGDGNVMPNISIDDDDLSDNEESDNGDYGVEFLV